MRLPTLLKITLFNILLIFCSYVSPAQAIQTDSALHATQLENALSFYHQSLFPETGLYNGPQYVEYAYTLTEGTPFFEAAFSPGDIVYDNVLYKNVPMLYDLVKEQVVINDPHNIYKISLLNKRISGFTLYNHHFVRLRADSTDKKIIETGFYDELYLSKDITLYKKTKKNVEENITSSQGLNRFIVQTINYYFKKENKFYEVSSKKDVLKVLDDRKKDVHQFITKNKLKLRKDKENSLKRIAAFYDSITQNN